MKIVSGAMLFRFLRLWIALCIASVCMDLFFSKTTFMQKTVIFSAAMLLAEGIYALSIRFFRLHAKSH